MTSDRLRYGSSCSGLGGQTEVGDLDDRPPGAGNTLRFPLEVAMHDAQMVRGR